MRRLATVAGILSAFAPLAAGAAPPPDPGVLPAGVAPGFAAVAAPRSFAFPRDHGPHPEFRQEWWYVTGNLDATDGGRFGFELTFFRFALAPDPPAGSGAGAQEGGAPPAASAWRTRQIYLAHFAVTDVAGKRFRYAQKLARGALGLAGAQGPPLHVWIDDWTFGAAGAAAGDWKLAAAQEGYALELELHPLTSPVLNGEAGLSLKSDAPGSASYYYSMPRIAVRGTLLEQGKPLAVQGLAWLDREWGSGGLGPDQAGWDWFALQLDDGTALMFYALRGRDGGRDRHSAGTWVEGSGEARSLTSAAVDIDVTGHWTSAGGVRYPSGWRLRVPSLALDVSVHPVLADQELGTSPRYFEGAVDASGTREGRPLRGRGYVELVGYAPGR
ncbi:MAG TPA: lipocalin-like domain-containing protein [Steroidobacteraceae bacterium]|nr:lipocalin-like domain-containing protein [Steroidobacteraceae bacterium]